MCGGSWVAKGHPGREGGKRGGRVLAMKEVDSLAKTL